MKEAGYWYIVKAIAALPNWHFSLIKTVCATRVRTKFGYRFEKVVQKILKQKGDFERQGIHEIQIGIC